MRTRPLIKVAIALVLLSGLGVLFVRSARSTRAEPYTIDREWLRRWTLAAVPAQSPADPMLVLQPPTDLTRALFHQIFTRAMESLRSPAVAAVPLLLQREFDALSGRVTPEALLAAARQAGLESTPFEARCLGYRRVSAPGVTEQLYFVLFDAPGFVRFREQVGALAGEGTIPHQAFDPAAQSPILLIAAADSAFSRWLPLRADPATDCIAPVVAR